MFEAINNCYALMSSINNDRYEAVLENLYLSCLSAGDIAIDIGAHVGRHTIPMAKIVGNEGRVYAFEPLPDLFSRLQDRLKEDNIDHIVQLYPLALSREAGSAEFLHVEDAPGLSGLKERTSHAGHEINRIQVDVAVLDDLMPKENPIRFIKIDAEGADFFILLGASEILRRDRPLVVFESGRINAFPAKSYGYSEEEFTNFFKQQGYVLYDIAGFKYDPKFWGLPTLNDFVAIPEEQEGTLRNILLAAVLSEFVTPPSP